MMNCEIIKDLLPLYIDSLSSEESNIEITAHLQGCTDCNQVYEQMKTNIFDEPKVLDTKAINPFRTLNKRILKKRVLSIIATGMICAAIGLGCYSLFATGWTVHSEDVTIDCSYSDTQVLFHVALTNGRNLSTWGMSDSAGAELGLLETLRPPFRNEKNFSSDFIYAIDYIDENGNLIGFSEEYKLIIKCKDKDFVYSLKELVEKKAM